MGTHTQCLDQMGTPTQYLCNYWSGWVRLPRCVKIKGMRLILEEKRCNPRGLGRDGRGAAAMTLSKGPKLLNAQLPPSNSVLLNTSDTSDDLLASRLFMSLWQQLLLVLLANYSVMNDLRRRVEAKRGNEKQRRFSSDQEDMCIVQKSPLMPLNLSMDI
ncbi:hypothetical protein Tco_0201757 [Tanacetum coccineum]